VSVQGTLDFFLEVRSGIDFGLVQEGRSASGFDLSGDLLGDPSV
jgi:hypothetical protein